MSKQRPILFNVDMVIAIDGNLKTETRRTRGLKELNEDPNNWIFMWQEPDKNYLFTSINGMCTKSIKCPYGQLGDVLYVRETWCKTVVEDESEIGYLYKADEIGSRIKWKPSIHMPKEAARIWLQIVEVSVERLKEITQQGAKDEGVKLTQTSPLSSFIALWDRINGTGEFNSNPWVWVVKFKKIPKP